MRLRERSTKYSEYRDGADPVGDADTGRGYCSNAALICQPVNHLKFTLNSRIDYLNKVGCHIVSEERLLL